MKSSPKVQIDDDTDLIDEDSLLTEEDLRKPQLPAGKSTSLVSVINSLVFFLMFGKYTCAAGDCEVGSTRKACRNCTCGRAEAEEEVLKLELTTEQINNPQSACGNVCTVLFLVCYLALIMNLICNIW